VRRLPCHEQERSRATWSRPGLRRMLAPRFGWYLEPAYDYSFAGGHQQSIGLSAGLLIGIR
jgi:hypothetical protein